MVQHGFVYGLFKVSQSGAQDCSVEGMTIFRGIISLIHKMATSLTNERDLVNLMELIFLFSERCNYMATPQGQVVVQIVYEYIERHNRFGVLIGALIQFIHFMVNLVDDIAVFFYRGNSLIHHWDAWNLSVLIGKVMNIIYQVWVLGWAFRGYTDHNY